MIRWFSRSVALLVAVVAAATLVTWRGGDPDLYPPAPGEAAVAIEVVSNGFHSGLAVPRPAMAEGARRLGLTAVSSVAERFPASPVLEIGWGEARFYRSTPTLGSIDPWLSLSALFRPGNDSVVHVVALPDRAVRVLAAQIVPVTLSAAGFDALLKRLERELAKEATGQAIRLGPGLAGDSLFYAGVETFSLFRLCNHWTSTMLAAAGVPTVGAWATVPDGLLLDLRWRAGLPILRPAEVAEGLPR